MNTAEFQGFIATVADQWRQAQNMTTDELVVWRQKLGCYTDEQARAGLRRYLAGPDAKWKPTIRQLTEAIIQERMQESTHRELPDEGAVEAGRKRMLDACREIREMLR